MTRFLPSHRQRHLVTKFLFPLHYQTPSQSACLHTSRMVCGYRISSNIRDCYQLLGVGPEVDDEELKEAYLNRAKEYHPDSAGTLADPKKFHQVQEAYRTIKAHRIDQEAMMSGVLSAVGEDDDEKIQHKVPQHRQYLNNEGVGYGTPSQRQKQYQQHKMNRASEAVTNKRISLIQSQYEDALLVKDKEATRKRTVKSGMDRLVEDLIQESMAKGEFDDLPGKGKPLREDLEGQMLDKLTYNLNKIVIDQGFAPEWVRMNKDIRTDIVTARTRLEHARIRAGPDPLSPTNQRAWSVAISAFRFSVIDINKMVDRLNMVAPTMQQQTFRYDIEKEISTIKKRYTEQAMAGHIPTLPQENTPKKKSNVQFPSKEKTSAKNVWQEIKGLFSSS